MRSDQNINRLPGLGGGRDEAKLGLPRDGAGAGGTRGSPSHNSTQKPGEEKQLLQPRSAKRRRGCRHCRGTPRTG